MINFQEMIAKLTAFWARQGCLVHQGYDLEVGAGTFNPATFLRCLGPEPYSAVYVEPSRRPKDGRYGENPNRLQFYHQMQVILKPSPPDIQTLYLKSLEEVGLDLKAHDIRFVHDDWENPTIGAWGLGWEVWADGMEVTQFTYFQAVGGLTVKPVSGEITYGLERLALYLQNVDSFFDLKWNDEITYGEVFKRSEWEWSHYNFTEADAAMWLRHFEDFERECKRLVAARLPIPAYDFVMKASHAFNILDARGVISVTERTGYMGRIRALAKLLAESYLESREEQRFPLLKPALAKPAVHLPPIPTKGSVEEREDFLLEIGCEELPALFLPLGLQQLEKKMAHLLKEHSLAYDHLQVLGTPRRLAVLVKGLQGAAAAQHVERKGPALEAAFDEKGLLTQAGRGFLVSLGFGEPTRKEIEQGKAAGLEIRSVKGHPYLFASFEKKGVMTRALLAEKLPQLITGLEFPKAMRWSDLEIEFARPLRWFVALYGKEVIPFTLAGLLSSHLSYGHRQLADVPIPLEHASHYTEQLRHKWVMVDVEERKKSILDQLHTLEKSLGAQAVAKERVMAQVLHLVEWPFLLAGAFDPHFLKAPKEVLASEMIEHQKYFPLANEQGALIPHFVIVSNNTPTPLICQGHQRALSPRLADGMFLYEADLKIPLEKFNQKLEKVIFQKELGTVWDKVERVKGNVAILHHHLPLCPLKEALRAAELCKADLASELVGEFPELQGVVGRLYALHQGESHSVASAIDEHWMPRGEKAPLPQTPCGLLVSIADKIDNFLSCYALGLTPTSSSDPYSLRRQAMGILKMLIGSRHHLLLPKVLQEALQKFKESPSLSPTALAGVKGQEEHLTQEILHFFEARLRSLLVEEGFAKDEIEAVLISGVQDPYDLFRKLEALHTLRTRDPALFGGLLEVYTRSKKILVSQKGDIIPDRLLSRLGQQPSDKTRFPPPSVSLIEAGSEKTLFDKVQQVKKSFHLNLVDRREPKGRLWNEAFALLVELKEPLALYFEEVKILAEDPQIQLNRLGLLQEVWDLCEELADFSKLQS